MKKIILMVMFVFLASAAQLRAEAKGAIELKSVAEVDIIVKSEKGETETKRVEASQANVTPGDTVIFTTFFSNNGKEQATGVSINNPVPKHMVYLDGTAEGAGTKIDFSVDGGKTFGAPKDLKTKGTDGKEKRATAADYTTIRWTFEKPVAAGAKGSVVFKAKVK